MHMDPLINTACRTSTVMNPIKIFPTDLTGLVNMKPAGSLLLLVSMVCLFLFAGEYYIWNEILDQTGQCQQSWCDVVYYNDDDNMRISIIMMIKKISDGDYHIFRRNFTYKLATLIISYLIDEMVCSRSLGPQVANLEFLDQLCSPHQATINSIRLQISFIFQGIYLN